MGREAYLLDILLENTNTPAAFTFFGENGTYFDWGTLDEQGNWTGMLGAIINGTVDMLGMTYGLSMADDARFAYIYPVEIDGFYIVKHKKMSDFLEKAYTITTVFSTQLWLAFIGIVLAALITTSFIVLSINDMNWRLLPFVTLREAWKFMVQLFAQTASEMCSDCKLAVSFDAFCYFIHSRTQHNAYSLVQSAVDWSHCSLH